MKCPKNKRTMGGGGGHSQYILVPAVGCVAAHKQGEGVLGTDTSRKRGILGTGTTHKNSSCKKEDLGK